MSGQPDTPADGVSFDPGRILATLDQHQVEYLLVGGLGAQAHGALRATFDIEHANWDKDQESLPELRALRKRGNEV